MRSHSLFGIGIGISLILFLGNSGSSASPKPPISPEEYARWESLGPGLLSPDGRWLAYEVYHPALAYQVYPGGNGELRVQDLDSAWNKTIPLASGPVFSQGGQWLAYTIGQSAKGREPSKAEPLLDELGLLDLKSGKAQEVEDVASFRFDDSGSFLAMQRYPRTSSSSRGADLVVRHLCTGADSTFRSVSAFAWSGKSSLLAMVVDAEAGAGNSVQIYDPSQDRLRLIDSAAATYTGLTWREHEDDLAVLRSRPDPAGEDKTFLVLAWRGLAGPSPVQRVYDPRADNRFPADFRIVDFRSPAWSDDGSTLFVGIEERDRKSAAIELPPPSEARSDAVDVEVWHPRDVRSWPSQKALAAAGERRSELAAWHLGSDRFVRLAKGLDEVVTPVSHQPYAIVQDPTPDEAEALFVWPPYQDLYVVDTVSGGRRLLKRKVQYSFGASPEGRYLLYLDHDRYWTCDLQTGRQTPITEGIRTSFVNQDFDYPVKQKPPYGVAGWTKADRSIIVYDRYDLWEVLPDGSKATRLTNGAAAKIRHRYLPLDPEEKSIDAGRPLYLQFYGEQTKNSGYARLRLGRVPERLVWRDREVDRLVQARDAAVFAYVVQDFNESPNFFVGGADLKDARQVTHTNPFQRDFAWGHSELVDYRSRWGKRLQGALYYPAGYQPGRRYPMIVDIYEQQSHHLHTYPMPAPHIPEDAGVLTSRGYFVLRPDIVYRTGSPGFSALACVVPAVEKVIATGMIDPKRIGLMGSSWGAYETAFLVTQTDLFAAAVAEACASDLISDYLSVYMATGMLDARYFESSQGRMGVPLWDDLHDYVANSPVFQIRKLNTPLLVMFGDKDGAVNWNQGVELYDAARRNGKPVTMLVYEGEDHALLKRANQLDYSRRFAEWFDHYLKGAAAPGWITHGVSYLGRAQDRASRRGVAAQLSPRGVPSTPG